VSFHFGDTVGAHTIVAIVGNGGMGGVFKVEHTLTRRIEAMKVLLSSRAGSEGQRQRFLREIQVQASLSHPNIASVHNAFWLEDDLVMVMELVEGDSLQRVLERGRIPLASGLDYICQTLSALSYAHAHGVIHRDVTPANIIVTSDGTVKLTDFGLAKAPGDQRLTNSGALLGSPHYMPPEQVKEASDVDARADIYSVGAILYETATGRKAFAADSAFSTMLAHVDGALVAPIEINPSLPPALNDIILTALQSEPSARFQTADQFRAELERVKRAVAFPARRKRSLLANSRTLQFGVGAAAVGITLGAVALGLRTRAARYPVATSRPVSSVPAQATVASPPKPTPFSEPASVAAPTPPLETVAEPESPAPPRKRASPKRRARSQPAARAALPLSPPPAPEMVPAAVPAPETPAVAAIETAHHEPSASIGAEPGANSPAPQEKKGSRFRRFLGKIAHPFR
jgi:serine/threonine-protein kinase